MKDDTKRPELRLITPIAAPGTSTKPKDEERPLDVAIPAPTPSMLAAANYVHLVDETDASIPIAAAYLTCTGLYLTDAALTLYRQSVRHAPLGTFRRNIPPGMKSAKATMTWLFTHLSAIKDMVRLRREGAPRTPYARGADLTQAAKLAREEMDRAMKAAQTAGIWYEERYIKLFHDASEDLTSINAFVKAQAQAEAAAQEAANAPQKDLYVLGANALSSSANV